MKKTISAPTLRLIASYAFDWFAIAIIAIVGALFDLPGPYHRPFSLVNLSIQYPLVKEVIPSWLLVVVAIVVPAIIVFLIAIMTTACPASGCFAAGPKRWKRALCQWNAGWMGLGLSCALAFFFTQGLKNLVGKPRPNMLARCMPSTGEVQEYAVGQYGAMFSQQWALVNYGICTQTDMSLLDDGFRAFPSGHTSLSFAGLLYLALFLSAKLAITIPFMQLLPRTSTETVGCAKEKCHEDAVLPVHNHQAPHRFLDILKKGNGGAFCSVKDICRPFGCAAVPPVAILALPLIPIAAAIYIAATRYFQFYHDGLDVMCGALIGISSAWFGFRWSQLPCRRVPVQAQKPETIETPEPESETKANDEEATTPV